MGIGGIAHHDGFGGQLAVEVSQDLVARLDDAHFVALSEEQVGQLRGGAPAPGNQDKHSGLLPPAEPLPQLQDAFHRGAEEDDVVGL